jgi:hypothetical protein
MKPTVLIRGSFNAVAFYLDIAGMSDRYCVMMLVTMQRVFPNSLQS